MPAGKAVPGAARTVLETYKAYLEKHSYSEQAVANVRAKVAANNKAASDVEQIMRRLGVLPREHSSASGSRSHPSSAAASKGAGSGATGSGATKSGSAGSGATKLGSAGSSATRSGAAGSGAAKSGTTGSAAAAARSADGSRATAASAASRATAASRPPGTGRVAPPSRHTSAASRAPPAGHDDDDDGSDTSDSVVDFDNLDSDSDDSDCSDDEDECDEEELTGSDEDSVFDLGAAIAMPEEQAIAAFQAWKQKREERREKDPSLLSRLRDAPVPDLPDHEELQLTQTRIVRTLDNQIPSKEARWNAIMEDTSMKPKAKDMSLKRVETEIRGAADRVDRVDRADLRRLLREAQRRGRLAPSVIQTITDYNDTIGKRVALIISSCNDMARRRQELLSGKPGA